MMSIERSFSLL